MHFVQNFPFIGILLTLICAVISSALELVYSLYSIVPAASSSLA